MPSTDTTPGYHLRFWEVTSNRRIEELIDGALSATPPDRFGLITDVDGTISHITGQPSEAAVSSEVIRLLGELAQSLSLVALVSGRSVKQLRRLVPVEGLMYVGNHGLEWGENRHSNLLPEVEGYLGQVADATRYLERRLRVPGVIVENKGPTGAVHYRLSGQPADARETILGAIAGCLDARGLRVTEGRMVVNLLPPVTADKGTAVVSLVQRAKLSGVIYIGDDVTDLDAFRALRSLRESGLCRALLIGICGRESPSDLASKVDYCLEGVKQASAFLKELARCLRSGRRAPGRAGPAPT